MKKLFVILFLALFLLGCTQANNIQANQINLEEDSNHFEDGHFHDEEYHVHVDFLVVLQDKFKDFSKLEFMSNKDPRSGEIDASKSPIVHLHDGIGRVVHVHSPGVTWSLFFDTLGMKLTDSCFVDETGKQFCEDEENKLRFFVKHDGDQYYSELDFLAETELLDLDQVLILFGQHSDADILFWQSQVSNNACIYSEKCPQRGPPPKESNCIVGTKCSV